MSKTWVLIANRSNARLFTNDGSNKELTLSRDIAHTEGHFKDQDFGSDKPGRSFDSGGQGRHAMGKSESPAEHETARFAGELAAMLNKGRGNNEFSRLVLAAEPGFLGTLKNALDDQTAKLVTDTVDKDFVRMADAEIPAAILQHIKL
jgi:protein required for attachment to host cells